LTKNKRKTEKYSLAGLSETQQDDPERGNMCRCQAVRRAYAVAFLAKFAEKNRQIMVLKGRNISRYFCALRYKFYRGLLGFIRMQYDGARTDRRCISLSQFSDFRGAATARTRGSAPFI
jgi:hypothetical protein